MLLRPLKPAFAANLLLFLSRRTFALSAASQAFVSQEPMAPHPASAATMPRRTFYRRQLPDSCTALSSPQGREKFASALHHKGLKAFFPLMEQFTTQSEPAYCGISTLVIVLNALSVDPRRTWKGPWRWYTENMLNCCMDLEEVKQTGITMSTFSCLGRCQGLHVEPTYSQDSNLEEFREAVEKACVEQDEDDRTHEDDSSPRRSNPYLVVSYSRRVLGQTGTGHFSPIGAYDKESDSCLILDTARFKYGAHWVPLPLLFEATQPIDPDTGKSRGYVLLSFEPTEDESLDGTATPFMPASILLTARKAQSSLRLEYKQFLAKLKCCEVKWGQAVDFWTDGGRRPKRIFDMMQPQLIPMEADVLKAVDSVRDAIEQLVPLVAGDERAFPEMHADCRANYNRTINLVPEEAILLVYLASLEPRRRREIVLSDKVNAADWTRQQILTEAELVQFAIDESEELSDDEHTN